MSLPQFREIVRRSALRLKAKDNSTDVLVRLTGKARHRAWLALTAKQRQRNREFTLADRRLRRLFRRMKKDGHHVDAAAGKAERAARPVLHEPGRPG